MNSCPLPLSKGKRKRGEEGKKGEMQEVSDLLFLERECLPSFSLSFCAIRPSAVFGTRRRTALRGEGFAWVPDLVSFLKL